MNRTEESKQFDIIICHVPTWDGKFEDSETKDSIIRFAPFIDDFSDNYKSTWESKPVLGRMDNISTFKQTTRVISLQFTIPCENKHEAQASYNNCKKLSLFLYPVYKEIKKQKKEKNFIPNELANKNLKPTTKNLYKAAKLATTLEQQLDMRQNVSIMSSPPLLKIRFANLIANSYSSDGDFFSDDGLYGYLDGFNYKPEKEAGFFIDKGLGTILPKVIKANLTFNVIHTNPLGWNIENKTRS